MMMEAMTPMELVFQVAMGAYLTLLFTKSILASKIVIQQRRLLATSSGLFDAGYSLTIAQPILSGDPLLGERLLRSRRQVPSNVRFVWLVDKQDTEARRIVAQLANESRNECSNVAVVLCEEAPDGTNPKSWKLQKALEGCDTEFFCVLDDDTVIDNQSLRDAGVHLVHCDLYTGLPRYEVTGSVWGRLVAHFVNNNAVLTYLPLLNFWPPLSINGMFYIVRTQPWKALGGFVPLMNRLCDDYAVQCHTASHNWRVFQGISPQYVQTSVSSASHYVAIQHRWNLFALIFLREQAPHLKVALFLLLVLPPILLWCTLLASFFGTPLFVTAILVLLARHLILEVVHRATFRCSPQLSPLFSIIAELLQPLHGLHALCVRTIRWRSRTIQVSSNTRFRVLPAGSQ